MLIERVHEAITTLSQGTMYAFDVRGCYTPGLKGQMYQVLYDLQTLALQMAEAELAWCGEHAEAIPVEVLVYRSVARLEEYGESTASVGGVTLEVDEAIGKCAIMLEMDSPIDMPSGDIPLLYDRTRYAHVGEAFAAILSATPPRDILHAIVTMPEGAYGEPQATLGRA